jgi:hypothetical protein
MKTKPTCVRPFGWTYLLVPLLAGWVCTSLGQTGVSNLLPVVTIQATDPNATWSGDTGTFTVFRRGNPTNTLTVLYSIQGTASNGVDYVRIPNTVQIPADTYSNSIVITPIDLGQTNIKTVTLVLTPPPPVPTTYLIGSPSSATVYISRQPITNLPPVVRITSPPEGAVYRAPVNIPIFAFAADRDDLVASVEFFADGVSLGQGRHVMATAGPGPTASNVWALVWTNAALGTNIPLTALATDARGASTLSDPVHISVLASPPPPTNRPPIVSIIASDPIAIEGTNCWPWIGPTAVPSWTNWLGGTPTCRFFTNCGPKNATFTVYRLGDTNDTLTVTYNIGGTASNGVDYVPLPGWVDVPAGQRRADITVVPLDDGPPDITSTVILRLNPGTNYVLGRAAAGAIILDSQTPRPTTTVVGNQSGQTFNLANTGPNTAWYHIETSPDLVNWTSVCTNQVFNGVIDFVDPDPANATLFYRAVPEAGPPPQ